MLRTSLHRIRELTIILFAACIAYIFHYSFSLIGIGDVCALFEQNCSEYKITYLENCVKPKEKKEELQQNLSVISREYFHYLASHLKDTPYPGITKYIYYTSAELQLKPLKNVKPLKSGFNLIFNDIQNFNYLLEMFPCTKKKRHSLSFLVVVISAPNHFDKRKIIRETWLRKLKIQSNLKSLTMSGFGFIVGLTEDRNTKMRIKGESDLYGDILKINMVDNYYNLTLKTAGLINWIHNRCSKVDFVVKVDDDVFINVQNLISLIKILDPSEKTIYGSAADSIPLRNKKSKLNSIYSILKVISPFWTFRFLKNNISTGTQCRRR
jgi:acetylgalactosaminyl-O-glycosyl-glycoprotein beta-1,3-N-acetylglucosaminyltransferase